MQVRETPKFYVLRFRAYGEAQLPANVYYDKAHFSRTAQMHGWGNRKATEIVDNCGSKVQLIEVLHDTMQPSRVVYQ